MARILILYGTTEGQTRKICEHAGETLRAAGHDVSVEDANMRDRVLGADEADAVIVGASLHAGVYQASIVHFLHENRDRLQTLPTLFLSVSLAAAHLDPEMAADLDKCVERLTRETGVEFRQVAQVAGALRYTQYDFFKRLVMRLISTHYGGPKDTHQDFEFTDWPALERTVRDFASAFTEAAA